MTTFDKTEPVVVVIGSGAGGGTVGYELAREGIDVVCLEAGPRLSMADIKNDEAEMFGKLTWLDPRTGSGGVLPEQFPAWICKTVGGTTMHWAAAALRFQDHEWKPRTTYGDIDGSSLIDWPVDAEPGTYRGTVTVRTDTLPPITVPAEAEVIGWRVPDPLQFQTVVESEQSPYGVAKAYQVPLWSERHFGLIESSFEQLARIGNDWLGHAQQGRLVAVHLNDQALSGMFNAIVHIHDTWWPRWHLDDL